MAHAATFSNPDLNSAHSDLLTYFSLKESKSCSLLCSFINSGLLKSAILSNIIDFGLRIHS